MNDDHIETSWDDGHPCDLRLADVLQRHKISAVFYVPVKNAEGREVMNGKQIEELSHRFEIAAHTYHHVDLTRVNGESAREEVYSAKAALEDCIGGPVRSFGFPRGRYNRQIVELVKSAGFAKARSARLFNVHPPSGSGFVVHPNVHFYPHSRTVAGLHCVKMKDGASLYERIQWSHLSQVQCAVQIFRNRRSIHIWGHSWEIDELGLWDDLGIFLKRLSDIKKENTPS